MPTKTAFHWPANGEASAIEGDRGDELRVMGPLVWDLYAHPSSDQASFCMATERVVVELFQARSRGDLVRQHAKEVLRHNCLLPCSPSERLIDRMRCEQERPFSRQMAFGLALLDIAEGIACIYPQPVRLLHVMASDLKRECNHEFPLTRLHPICVAVGACLELYAQIQISGRGSKWYQDIPRKKGDGMSDTLSEVIRGTFAEYYLLTRNFPQLPSSPIPLAEAEKIVSQYPSLLKGHDFIQWMPQP